MTRTLSALALALCSFVAVPAQQPQPSIESLLKQATDAYAQKDYAGFLSATERARAILPDSTRLWYNTACGYALTGDAERAAAWLQRIAATGLVCPAATDSDFASITKSLAFQAVLARLATNAAPVHRADRAFPLEERGIIPEGLAYDPVEHAFFVSSVRKRKVLRIDGHGKVTDFLAGRPELRSAFGIAVDAKRRRLWVTTAELAQSIGFRKAEDGASGLLAYDLATGKLVASLILPAGAAPHAISDLAIAPNGDVFATDSRTPSLYVAREGATVLEPVPLSVSLPSPQGLAFSSDGKRLYLADYSRGIYVVDVATSTAALLAHPEDVCLLGVDGLAIAGNCLYATQNGIRPERVVRVTLDDGGTKATRLDVLEANTPDLGEPTLGTIADGWFYFNADSQWDRFDENGNLPPDSELRGSSVMRTRL